MTQGREHVARRAAVAAVFFTLGLSGGIWAARIPAIKGGLHLSPGTLGLALLGPGIGSILAMPATGAVLATVAPRRVVQLGLLALAGFLPLTALAGSAWQLFALLAGWGAGIGIADVGMNTEAADVQEQLGRAAMSRFHAAYSIGGLVGAGAGALAAATGVSAKTTFIAAAVVVAVLGIGAAQAFAARPRVSTGGRQPRRARAPQWSWALIALAAMAFGSFLGEGAATDWSAVYLHSSLGAPPGLAAIAYGLFACAMTAGRLAGDQLADRMGPARLIRLSAGIAAAGFGSALVIGQVWSGLAGFAVLGAGLSVIVPLVFSAASRLGRPGPNLALVTSCGYFGILVGPAIIGGLANLTSLPAALGSVVVLCALTALLAGMAGRRPAAEEPGGGAGPRSD
ncbi:MAG TPA: MFS transporter [Streptosporangiaceae bacterium]|nr:MFS transporter [Streptosporangiaceae bacterium]